jgi:uncharacterized protein (DUF2126 family)
LATSSCFKLLICRTFIGPTSQAPRIDEGRDESYMKWKSRLNKFKDKEVPFWMVDRIFRNLLTDITGNTELNFVSINYTQIHQQEDWVF